MDTPMMYDGQFFDMHILWRQEYVIIADVLHKLLRFSSVIDLGCGNGFILARLKELGKNICGVDGSSYALEAVPDEIKELIILHDLAVPFCISRFDLVICTEVAEHLDAEYADILVDNVCANSDGLIYFTAASPGQGGFHHSNEQPHSYWTEKFSERGYELKQDLTKSLRSELRKVLNATWWFTENSMIFQARERQAQPLVTCEERKNLINWIHRSKKIPGWQSDAELVWLYNTVRNLPERASIVEVGPYMGRSTSAIAQAAALDPTKTVTVVDHFKPLETSEAWGYSDVKGRDLRQEFLDNMAMVGVKANVIVKPSLEAARMFADGLLDMVYIDACHDEFDQDLRAWRPKVKPGGILSGHDAGWSTIEPILASEKRTGRLNYSVAKGTSIWYAHQIY